MPVFATFLLISLPWLNPFSPGPSPAVVPWLVTLGCFALLLLLAARVRLVEVAASAWLAAALLSAVMGLLQYVGATAIFGPWINSAGLGEAYANLRQRNQFATLIHIGLASLLWWVTQAQSTSGPSLNAARGARLGWGMAAMAAAVLLGMGNAASSSRTGLVQLLMLIVMAWAGAGGQRAAVGRVLLAGAFGYGLAALSLPTLVGSDLHASGILARLQEGDSSCESRLTLWRNVLHLIAQKPWLGWGWGELDYAHFITLYPGPRFCNILDNAHNLPLHLAVELGLPVAVLLCGGAVGLVWRARPWCERDASRQLAWRVLALILLHSLLEYPLWYGPFQVAFGLSLWLLWRPPAVALGASSSTALDLKCFWHYAQYGRVFIAILSIAFVACAGWDYYRISQLYRVPTHRAQAYRDHTLDKVRDSWLFAGQVRFAELTTTPLTAENAAQLHALATDSLHFSPEPRVIEKLIESAVLLGRDEEALFYLQRYQAAFAESHARWAAKDGR